jgi:hypothetical protein
MYIGEKEIKATFDEGDSIKVEFVDEPSCSIDKKLFEIIKSEEKGVGNVTDATVHYFSKLFLAQLAEYDLEMYMIEGVSQGIRTLAHNLREGLISKTFKCDGALGIKLKTLIEGFEPSQEEK